MNRRQFESALIRDGFGFNVGIGRHRKHPFARLAQHGVLGAELAGEHLRRLNRFFQGFLIGQPERVENWVVDVGDLIARGMQAGSPHGRFEIGGVGNEMQRRHGEAVEHPEQHFLRFRREVAHVNANDLQEDAVVGDFVLSHDLECAGRADLNPVLPFD